MLLATARDNLKETHSSHCVQLDQLSIGSWLHKVADIGSAGGSYHTSSGMVNHNRHKANHVRLGTEWLRNQQLCNQSETGLFSYWLTTGSSPPTTPKLNTMACTLIGIRF